MADNAAEDELDILRIQQAGRTSADVSQFQAALDRQRAKEAGRQKFVGAGASLLRGFGT